jgi:hypothetical protein
VVDIIFDFSSFYFSSFFPTLGPAKDHLQQLPAGIANCSGTRWLLDRMRDREAETEDRRQKTDDR